MAAHESVTAMLACEVSQGMFSSERGIVVHLPGGRRVSTLVDRRDVQIAREPTGGETVDGRVRVAVVDHGEDWLVVDLPQPGLTEGTRLRVPRSLVVESA